MAAAIILIMANLQRLPFTTVLESVAQKALQYAEQKLTHSEQTPTMQSGSTQSTTITSAAATQARSDLELPGDYAVNVPAGAVNYLEPADPSLKPGQIKLDGVLYGTLDSGYTDFQIRALWMTLPGERRTVFAAPRLKTITVDSSTRILEYPSLTVIFGSRECLDTALNLQMP